MRAFLFFLLILALVLAVVDPFSTDMVVARDRANLYSDFGQFGSNDLRAKACVVDNSIILEVVDSGFNGTWNFRYYEFENVPCADGRTLLTAYGAVSEFKSYR